MGFMRALTIDDLVLVQWHLVLCKPNQHHIARTALSRLKCDVFLPLQEARRRWRGRFLSELRPVFPGYIFVGMDPARPVWQPVRTSPGVSQVVSFGGRPANVPPEVVAGLMARCDGNGVLSPLLDDFSVGDKVRIISGPFAEFVTAIDSIDPDRCLHVLLDLLGRSTKVVVDREMAVRQ
jgi:transcriptional antiterminator RfaH